MDDELQEVLNPAMSAARSRAESVEHEAANAEMSAVERDIILRDAGIPTRSREALQGCKDTAPIRSVRAWMADAGQPIIVLSGGVGCGKTVAAAWWLSQAIGERPKRKRRWWSAFELARLGMYSDTLPELVMGPLVIDDLCVEFVDERGAWLSTLEWLLNERYEHGSRTAITTNLAPQQFKTRYGERIHDRLKDGALWAHVLGPSLRKAK